jgi:energy-coupling factor transport system ATP-binding protein
MTAIEVRNLSVSYGGRVIMRNFSLAVEPGEAVLIRGPSGCGKSTLLNAVCGLIPGSISAEISGEVLLSGKNVRELSVIERAKEIGIVFQNPETQLFCDTVEDEIAFGLENLCYPKNEIADRIDEMLTLTNMEKYRFASPKELSGGQKQLVVLAAVLALNPKVLLLDEALSQLDDNGKQSLTERLLILRNEGHTLLMVDHDDDLRHIASRILNWEEEQL